MLRRLKHWLAHRLGTQRTTHVAWDHRDGSRWDAYVCECGAVSRASQWMSAAKNRARKDFFKWLDNEREDWR